jgi:hypothetical protein
MLLLAAAFPFTGILLQKRKILSFNLLRKVAGDVTGPTFTFMMSHEQVMYALPVALVHFGIPKGKKCSYYAKLTCQVNALSI